MHKQYYQVSTEVCEEVRPLLNIGVRKKNSYAFTSHFSNVCVNVCALDDRVYHGDTNPIDF